MSSYHKRIVRIYSIIINMTSSRKIVVVGALAIITLVQAFPKNVQNEADRRQPRQDDDDDATTANVNFGANVAQIIAGAFTGNIDSIIKGSFGFIEDPNINKLSHNTWETLKGNPTKTPPWATTSAKSVPESESESETEPPVASPPSPPPAKKPESVPSAPSPSTQAEAVVVSPQNIQAIPPRQPVVESGSAGSGVYTPEVYYPGSANYPTKPPTRTRQSTYATLAPLSVIDGTATEPEEPSETRTTTEEDGDDGDEEGVSAELASGSTTVVPQTNSGAETTKAATATAAATGGNVETTTEEDDDQDQIDYNYKI